MAVFPPSEVSRFAPTETTERLFVDSYMSGEKRFRSGVGRAIFPTRPPNERYGSPVEYTSGLANRLPVHLIRLAGRCMAQLNQFENGLPPLFIPLFKCLAGWTVRRMATSAEASKTSRT